MNAQLSPEHMNWLIVVLSALIALAERVRKLIVRIVNDYRKLRANGRGRRKHRKSAASDTPPPTVSITPPVVNATLSGTVTVPANATNDVAKVDGANASATTFSAAHLTTDSVLFVTSIHPTVG